MKFITCLFLMSLIFPRGFSQKIIVNETDKFTKQHRVESDFVYIKHDLFCFLQIKFRAVDTSCFVIIKGGGNGCAVGAINSDDYIMLLLENDSTVKAYSTGLQSYTVSPGADRTYNHQYRISKEGLKMLNDHKGISIRKTFNNNYQDFDLKEKFRNKLSELAILFYSKL